MQFDSWIYLIGEEDAVNEIDTRVEVTAFDHGCEFGFNGALVGVEGGGECRECHVRERDEVLVYRFAADLEVELVEVALEVEVEEVVWLVRIEDGEAGGVFGGDKEGDGTADVRFQFEVVTEGGIIEHEPLQLVAGHGGECAETTVDGDVIGCQDFVVGFLVGRVVELGLSHAGIGLEEHLGGFAEVAGVEMCETHGCREFGGDLVRIWKLLARATDALDV